MAKRIEEEDGFYRIRRGQKVRIPDEWIGETLHPQTKRKRPSKDRARKREPRNRLGDDSYDWSGYRTRRYQEI